MRRRSFITLLGSATVAWPAVTRAQGRTMRIGVLAGVASTDPQMKARLAALQEELRRLGWDDGRNVQIDYRFASGVPEQARVAARELVALQPDLVVAHSTTGLAAVRNTDKTVQVVFVMVSEPVSQGFVKSL